MSNSFITKTYSASDEQRDQILPFVKSIYTYNGEIDTIKLLSTLRPHILKQVAKKNGWNMHALWSAIQYLLKDHARKHIELVFLCPCITSDEGILCRDKMLEEIKKLSSVPHEVMVKEAKSLSIQIDLFKMVIQEILSSTY